jgi:hypothetical protein
MARVVRPANTRKSEHWLRVLINQRPQLLRDQLAARFQWPSDEEITWHSPLADDEFAEYRDDCFLDRLNVQPATVPLADFWPRGGPRWDGLGTTRRRRPLLVEAKAYIEEEVTSPCGAVGRSLALIQRSLNQLKAFLRSSSPHDWSRLYYQYTNRLAHLYYLRELNGLDAYLIFVYFCHAPDVTEAPCEQEWQGANRLLKCTLSLGRAHRLSRYVADVFIDARQLVQAKQFTTAERGDT